MTIRAFGLISDFAQPLSSSEGPALGLCAAPDVSSLVIDYAGTSRMRVKSSPGLFAGAEEPLKRNGSSAGHICVAKDRCTSESYRLKAAECRDRAAATVDAATRVNYHELADYWNDMAREARHAETLGDVHLWP
jgi:hypothetical protein